MMQDTFFCIQGAENVVESPCYIFEEKLLKDKVEQIFSLMPSSDSVCFAMKANPFLVSCLDQEVDHFEVCSPGEYEICMLQNINPEKIIVSGVNKTEKSIERILDLSHGKGTYTIESELQYNILSKAAACREYCLPVLIRLSSGNQFGVDQEHFKGILEKVLQNKNLNFKGIHFFSGTQKKFRKIQKELEMLDAFCGELKQKYILNSVKLEYGPGLAVSYFKEDGIPSAEEQLNFLQEKIAGLTSFDEVGIEMGRFIASSCGFYFTKVIDIKQTEETNYAILDGGIHQLHYFGQMMGMKIPAIKQWPESQGETTYTLCGSLCTVNDVLVRNVTLHKLKMGDVLLFGECGAYSITECPSLFLSRELPAVYLHKEDGSYCCLRTVQNVYPFNTYKE